MHTEAALRAATLMVALPLFLLGCGEMPAPDRSPQTPSRRTSDRRLFDVTAETLWTRGGSEEDTLVSIIRSLRLDEGRLEVSDGIREMALSLDARDGRTRTVARSGATEQKNGRWCPAARRASWELNPSDPYPLLLRRDATIERRTTWPWPGFALEPSLRRQAWLVPGRRVGECILALMLGRGFARLLDGEVVYVRAYVDTFALPPVVVTVDSTEDRVVRRERLQWRRVVAAAVTRVGELLAVAGDGERGPAEGTVDLYRIEDGAYAGTWRLRSTISALAGDDSTLFVAHTRAGRPALVAVHLRLGVGQ